MRNLILSLFILIAVNAKASIPNEDSCFSRVYNELRVMLTGQEPALFKKAVFITENVYLDNRLDYEKFDQYITKLALLAKYWMKFNPLKEYHYSDSLQLQRNYAIFKLLKDTITVFISKDEYAHYPYTYDFNDFFGNKEWSNMFITKLLDTHTGNCHSMPYLYKILADEIEAPCWLALAPNHAYISNRCKKIGWYNTELTSGEFPVDAWIMASGYLPIQAVQTGIYMDTLSNQQSIALCVLDLAKGYEHKTKNYSDGFIIKCCDLSLEYFPLNVQAMLLKAETLKRIYEKQAEEKDQAAQNTYKQMEELYAKLFELGYREMPEKMYMQWLQSVVKERNKYSNRQVKETMPGAQRAK